MRLLEPDTYAQLIEIEGRPVWAGRTSWRDTVLRIQDPDLSELVLVRPDDTSKLVVTPPDQTGWSLGFHECGARLYSFTWRNEAEDQHVDVIDMPSLSKVTSHTRVVAAQPGIADPQRDIVFHADRGLRIVAEDQRTGEILWTTPLDPPTRRKKMQMDELTVTVTGNGRYVLAIWGHSSYHREYLNPELAVLDSATGRPEPVNQARFEALVDSVSWLDIVPGTDNLTITNLAVKAGGESRVVGLDGLVEVSLPALATVAKYAVPKDHWWRNHAPAQVVRLASRRVLFAGR